MFIITKMAPTRAHACCSRRSSEEKKARRLAQRFDRALNTMSHGLVMLEPVRRKVVVANAEARRLMGVKSSPDATCSAARSRRC